MARSDITDKKLDIINDNGSLLISVAQGEQIIIPVTLNWLSNLTGYTITAQCVEGDNIPGQSTTPPEAEAASPVIEALPIVDAVTTDNVFNLVIPKTLSLTWGVQPAPNDPVYGFFAVSIADTGVDNAQQIFVPPRGLIEVRYNPVLTT